MGKFYNLFNLTQGEEDKDKVREDIFKNSSFRGASLWILACAILIASIGLNMNSTAVIIGAMLISPLMGPIVGAGFALSTYDFNLLKKSGKNLLIATLVSLTVSTAYFYLSPFKEIQSELLSRTSPTIYDVMIAFFGGLVGAISMTRVEKGNPIPGVAIATALMPPLCTAGFGLATFNLKFFAGAMYLYTINCFFIGIATFLIIKYLKYRPVVTENKSFDQKLRYIITTLVLLMVVPSFYLAYSLLQEKKFTQNADRFIKEQFTDYGYTVIYKKIITGVSPRKIELAFLSKTFDSIEIKILNDKLGDFGITNAKLTIKQNTKDLKSEILSEINKSTASISEKDVQINVLSNELKKYKYDNPVLYKELVILFPEIQNIAIGKVQNFIKADSVVESTIVMYSADKSIDEAKLKQWLGMKMEDDSVEVFRKQ